LGQLQIESIRLFLHGSDQYVYDLYEVLLNDTIGIALAAPDGETPPVHLSKQHIRPVGFERDQGLLDYPAQSFLGYRLLSEYFAFPEKFLFADIGGWTGEAWRQAGSERELEIFLFLRRHLPDLERNVSQNTIQLGCCPAINLFHRRAEPIRLTHNQTQYRVVPDARRPLAHEVYSVDRVVALDPDHQEREFLPFYSIQHSRPTQETYPYWYASRRPAGYAGGQVDPGTEVFLSLVDLDMQPTALADWTVDVETTCLSRDLPRQLPFGGGQPHLQLASGDALIGVSCLTRPTSTLRPALRHGTMWRLISHLTLNHLSLSSEEDAADALREILKLYDYSDSSQTRAMIEGLLSVRSRRVVGRVGGEVAAGFCRGLEVAVHLDPDRFAGSGVFLFASVLERFLGLYSSINSFTRTVATTSKQEGVLRRWPPRAGERVLL
jgi:type VI secretion system protein ImpG